MAIVEAKGLHKVYPNGTVALKDIDVSIEQGESVVILGHNGSGKSTLFRCLTALEKPTDGEVHLFNTPIHTHSKRQLRPIRKRIGMVFQRFHLIHNLSVFQNVLFGGLGQSRFSMQTIGTFASNESREKAMHCMEKVGLAHLAKRRADELSGGQQQRIAIARMLMQDPDIILADEPIASLDPKAGREVMDLLWNIGEEREIAVISVLHQLDVAKEYGERAIALKAGEVMIDAPMKSLDDEQLASIYDDQVTEQSHVRKRKSTRIVGAHAIEGI